MLLAISFVLFFGYLAEFIFKKLGIPDILFLIGLGFLLGPNMLGYIEPLELAQFAPLFTTFALFFIVYNGAFSIDLASFAKGIKKGLGVTAYNFALSVVVVFAIMFFFTGSPMIALLCGFVMGGISSAFVIPVISNLKINDETYSMLALESTFTDVLVIVFSLSAMDIIMLNSFNLQQTATHLFALLTIAVFAGIIAAILWMFVIQRIFRSRGAYMLTIAYLILVYVFTELVGGSGVVAALFFGIVLRNSMQLKSIASHIRSNSEDAPGPELTKAEKRWGGVIPPMEIFFYSQISFFLKTFFFVYVGILFNVSNHVPLVIGLAIAVGLMIARWSSYPILRSLNKFDKNVVISVFARGLAAAAIAQEVALRGIKNADFIVDVTYSVIVFTIVFSSINVFMSKKFFADEGTEPVGTQAAQEKPQQTYATTQAR